MAPSRRLGALLAQLGANEPPSSSTMLCTTALSTENHPANQRYGLGEPDQRQLRTLTEDQLSLFWENGFLVVEGPPQLTGPSRPPQLTSWSWKICSRTRRPRAWRSGRT